MSVPLQFIDINGATLAYRIVGPKEAPLIITLHGGRGLGTHESDFNAYRSLGDCYRVLSFDQRGHGQSSLTKPLTFRQLVDDIQALRQAFVGDGKVIIIGGSFGGFIAQEYVTTYGDWVSHLVLRGTAPSHHHEVEAIENWKKRLHLIPLASVGMLNKVFTQFIDDDEMRVIFFLLNRLYVDENYDPDVALEKNRRTIYRAETHNDLYSEQEKYFDFRDKLGEVKAKTLIVVGANDWVCPPSQSKLIHSLIPGSILHIVPDANHAVHHEKNEFVIGEIRKLLIES
ncbi:hypothetical protein M231_04825 [Tremella mesenterica]|uniref:AB hydrolase-1 domain-containing protein n=1 Tax=Tremella mesenterica TaxID=5217 RepID=A0A4Q1BJU5_TREME|nr:hypothetical protein M231_04825 [Tremella mesenterica]